MAVTSWTRSAWTKAGVVAAASLLAGVFFAAQVYFFFPAEAGGGDARRTLGLNLPYCLLWGAFVPVVERLARRFPFEAGVWLRHLLLHAVVGLGLAIVVNVLAATIIKLLRITPFRMGLSWAETLYFGVRGSHIVYPVFWVVLLGVVAAQSYAALRDRDVRAAQLEASLSRAQLAALSAQLNPHFLFNALNTVSALLYTDRDAADRALARLGELLRMTLASGNTQEISLQDELALLGRYVELERLRFADRLALETRVPDGLLATRVPPFLLQPLVENAIHHGVSRRREGGHVVVEARTVDGAVLLTVADDGPGLPNGLVNEGIGLANTRARLDRLYGARGGLELVQPERGGLEVRVRIPRSDA